MKNKIKKWVENILTYAFLSCGILFIIFGILIIIFNFHYKNIFYPKTKINDVVVAGQSKNKIKSELNKKLSDFNQKIIFTSEGNVVKEIKPEDMGIEVYISKSINEAYSYGRDIFSLHGFKEAIEILVLGKNFKFENKIKEESFNLFVKNELEPLGVTSGDLGYLEEEGNIKIEFGENDKSLDKNVLVKNVKNNINNLSIEPIKLNFIPLYTQLEDNNLENTKNEIKNVISSKFYLKFEDKNWEINEEVLRDWLYLRLEDRELSEDLYGREIIVDLDNDKAESFLNNLKYEVEIKPENAKFQVNEDYIEIIKPSTIGRNIQTESTYNKLKQQAKTDNRELYLDTEEVEAKITKENIEKFKIKELIGSGESNFAGSPSNRIHNINNAAEILNGTFIEPQDTYSLVEHLGNVDAESGYLPELVIKENKTIPEYGGGLCQIATTLFRAAINAGFDITERQNHSYAVSYYNPQGIDAAIYIPHPDLRFVNNTDHTVLLQIKVDGYNLIFEFYGVRDGREVSIEGPFYWDRRGDGSFKARFTQVVKMSDGTENRSEFKSYYDSPDKYH